MPIKCDQQFLYIYSDSVNSCFQSFYDGLDEIFIEICADTWLSSGTLMLAEMKVMFGFEFLTESGIGTAFARTEASLY